MTDPKWTYKILTPSFSSYSFQGQKYVVYNQTISFTQVGNGNCQVMLNDKSMTLTKSKIIKLKRIILPNCNTYNAVVYYSYNPHIMHTINDKIKVSESNLAYEGISDIANKIETYTKDEIIGEIESLLNPDLI
jgi:hypothetical protein